MSAPAAPPATPAPAAAAPPLPRAGGGALTKQGAYGKVRVHRAPLAASLDEALALAAYAVGLGPAARAAPLRGASPDRAWCEAMLVKVSRSFAAVIQALPDHLREAVCVFYLVLRVS